jgi:hypothetical protein
MGYLIGFVPILYLAFLGVVGYVIYLVIKALKIYIKKNS